MEQTTPYASPGTDRVGTYMIRIDGNLDARWLEYFDSISIAVLGKTGSPSTTTICAHSVYKEALLGILNSLHNFGYQLVALEGLDKEYADLLLASSELSLPA